MLQKVRVTDPGDTDFLEGEPVDKQSFRDENERMTKRNIIGHLIPAGSGIYRYAEIDIEPPASYEAPPPRVEEPVAFAAADYCTLEVLLSITGAHFPSGPCISIVKVYAAGESSLIVTRDLTFWPPIVASSV